MRKGIHVCLLLSLLMLLTALVFTGCGSSEQEEAPNVEPITITLSIDFPEKSKVVDIREVPFKIAEDASVLQMIELYGNVNNISVWVDTTKSTLESIHGITNDVFKNDYVWKFKINGKYVSKGEADQILKDGDLVQFIYIKK